MNLDLEKLENELNSKKEEYINLKNQYEKSWIDQNFGKYIGQYTKFSRCHDGIPQKTSYLYVKDICCSSKFCNFINITGVAFNDITWLKGDSDDIASKEFLFSTKYFIDIDYEDAKFDIISKEEWEKQYNNYVRKMNKLIKSGIDKLW